MRITKEKKGMGVSGSVEKKEIGNREVKKEASKSERVRNNRDMRQKRRVADRK